MSLIGIGLLLGWFVLPFGYLVVAWGAWRLRHQTRLAPWLLASSVAAGLGQMATWGAESATWSFGALAGVIVEVLVCSIVIQLTINKRTRHLAWLLRLGLPASAFVLALAWLPTRGMLDGQNFLATAVFVLSLAMNVGLSVTLAFLLLSGRTNDLRDQAGPKYAVSGAHRSHDDLGPVRM